MASGGFLHEDDPVIFRRDPVTTFQVASVHSMWVWSAMDGNSTLCLMVLMQRENGPVALAALYVAGVVATIIAARAYALYGADFAKALLGVLQIVVTAGAIFSAWALQSKKRSDDARDNADAAADAALAVIRQIDSLAKFVSGRVFDGKSSETSLNGHADIIDEETKALSGLPLTALKPTEAAMELVRYRRFSREFALECRKLANGYRRTPSALLMARHNQLKRAEMKLRTALGRDLPQRLRDLPDSEELFARLKQELKTARTATKAG